MTIRIQRRGKAIVLNLNGRLTADDDATELSELVRYSIRLRARAVVLNVENVSRLDCAGIGLLVQLYCELRQSGAALRLANLEPRHKRMLEIVRLLPVFTVCDTVDEALDGRPNRARPPLATNLNTGSVSVDAV